MNASFMPSFMPGMMPGMNFGGQMGNPFIMMQMMQMLMMMMMMMGQQQGQCGCQMGFQQGAGNQFGNMMFPSMPNYGGGGMPYMGNGGGGNWQTGPMTGVNMNDIRGGTQFGNSLAQYAGSHANGPGGYCYRWVKQALRSHGVNLQGGSAYQAADQLAQNGRFHEVRGMRPDQLRQLPPGAVVVWNRGPGHQHGHISIALGNGMEASDKLRRQITGYGTQFRVFVPNG